MPISSTPFIALRALSRASNLPPLRSSFAGRQVPRAQQQFLPSFSLRFYSSPPSSNSPISSRLTDRPDVPSPRNQLSSSSHKPATAIRPPKPEYQITFTCTPCSTRSTHRVSKQGYHRGSVLITCPECRNRHVMSDHLGIFGDRKITIEDLMKEQGQLVKRGTLSEDGGDLEFWPDESAKTTEETKP